MGLQHDGVRQADHHHLSKHHATTRRSGGQSAVTAELMTLEVRSRRQWRAWLATHHAASSGIWLVFYKHHTGLKSMPYEDAVREALCFGWIDSLTSDWMTTDSRSR